MTTPAIAALKREKQQNETVKILLVDDSYYCMIALKTILQQYSLEADQAIDGKVALKLMAKKLSETGQTYSLIIVNFHIGITSTESIRSYIRTQAPHLPQPIIVCTADKTDQSERIRARKAKMNMLVQKPIFKATMQKILSLANLNYTGDELQQ